MKPSPLRSLGLEVESPPNDKSYNCPAANYKTIVIGKQINGCDDDKFITSYIYVYGLHFENNFNFFFFKYLNQPHNST